MTEISEESRSSSHALAFHMHDEVSQPTTCQRDLHPDSKKAGEDCLLLLALYTQNFSSFLSSP